jgi:hypothetical protein
VPRSMALIIANVMNACLCRIDHLGCTRMKAEGVCKNSASPVWGNAPGHPWGLTYSNNGIPVFSIQKVFLRNKPPGTTPT